MAVTTDDILAMGKGPVQPTFADRAAPPATSAPSAGDGATTGVEDVRYGSGLGTVTDTEQTPLVDGQQKGKKLTYAEIYRQMSPYSPPTSEELEKERKKRKREAVFAAIGDGISAMSNLYFTTQYAPGAFDPTQGMAATTKARFDKMKEEREENQRRYMDGFMRAMRWDAEDERDERNREHAIGREQVADRYREAADARAQARADRDAAMAQLRMDLMQGRIDQQEAAVEAKRIEADYAEAYWQSRIGNNGNRRPIGSGGKGDGYPWYDRDGNLHYASTYESMRQNSLNHGTWVEGTEQSATESERKDRRGRSKGTTLLSTTKPSKGYSAKPGGKKPNPMGGGTKKKKNPMS